MVTIRRLTQTSLMVRRLLQHLHTAETVVVLAIVVLAVAAVATSAAAVAAAVYCRRRDHSSFISPSLSFTRSIWDKVY